MDTNLRESASSAGFRVLAFWKFGAVQSAAVWCSLVQSVAVFGVWRLQQTAVGKREGAVDCGRVGPPEAECAGGCGGVSPGG